MNIVTTEQNIKKSNINSPTFSEDADYDYQITAKLNLMKQVGPQVTKKPNNFTRQTSHDIFQIDKQLPVQIAKPNQRQARYLHANPPIPKENISPFNESFRISGQKLIAESISPYQTRPFDYETPDYVTPTLPLLAKATNPSRKLGPRSRSAFLFSNPEQKKQNQPISTREMRLLKRQITNLEKGQRKSFDAEFQQRAQIYLDPTTFL